MPATQIGPMKVVRMADSVYRMPPRAGTDGPDEEHEKCPICGAPLVWQPLTMSMADSLDAGYWYCSTWPACSGIVNKAVSGTFQSRF